MEDVNRVRRNLLIEEDGVTTIEYALIAALIAIVIVATVTAVGRNVQVLYDAVAAALANA